MVTAAAVEAVVVVVVVVALYTRRLYNPRHHYHCSTILRRKFHRPAYILVYSLLHLCSPHANRMDNPL